MSACERVPPPGRGTSTNGRDPRPLARSRRTGRARPEERAREISQTRQKRPGQSRIGQRSHRQSDQGPDVVVPGDPVGAEPTARDAAMDQHPLAVRARRHPHGRHTATATGRPIPGEPAVHMTAGQTVRTVVAMRGPRRACGHVESALQTAEGLRGRSVTTASIPVGAQGGLGTLRAPSSPVGTSAHAHTSPRSSSGNGGSASGRTAMRMSTRRLSSEATSPSESPSQWAQRWTSRQRS